MRHQQFSHWQTGLLGSAIAVPFALSMLALPVFGQSAEPPDSEQEIDSTIELDMESNGEIEPEPELDAATEPAFDPDVDETNAELLPDESLAEAPAIVPSVATILPADVAAVILLSTQEEQWQSLLQYQMVRLFEESFGAVPLNPGSLSFVPYQVDYETAIAPWIGDYAATVIMPARPNSEATIAKNSMMVAPVTDASAIPQFLDAIRATRDELPTEMTYRGIPILAWAEIAPSFPQEEFEPIPSEPSSVPLPVVPPDPQPSSDLPENNVPTLEAHDASPDWEIADADVVEPDTNRPSIVKIEVEVDGEVITVKTTESGSRPFELDLPDGLETQIQGLEELESSEMEPPPVEPFGIEPFEPGSPEIETGEDFPLDESTLPPIPGLAIAVLPDFIALAASPEPIQQWLDNPVTHTFGVESAIAPPTPANPTTDALAPNSTPLPPTSPTPSDSLPPNSLTPDSLTPDSQTSNSA
ncbi:MAG: DUF3352 domain-containing protein, partial [Thainema sp.]